jgi:trk system potassium uptake protein TrkA
MKSILIIGMGEFGSRLAYKLDELGNEVCIVDASKDIVESLSNDFDNAYISDCTNKLSLSSLGPKNFDICVVAIGDNFQASLEITSLLKELGAKKIISKSATDIQSKFLKMAGADEIIYPEKDSALKLAIKCNANNLFDYNEVGDDYGIFEIKVPNEWIHKSLKMLNVRNKYKVNIIAINNSSHKVTIPDADYIFKDDDHIYVIGLNDDVVKLTRK